MDIIPYLRNHFIQCSLSDLCYDNNFDDYDNFRDFIHNHYNLIHIEKNNYIKYVKVKRQLLKVNDENDYISLINKINDVSSYLFSHGIFPKIDIRRYMYKLDVFFKLLESKKSSFLKTIKNVRRIAETLDNKTKIFVGINTLLYKYSILVKYSNKICHFINELIKLEKTYGIDQHLIKMNNMERAFLGTKSEYTVNKVIYEYVTVLNNSTSGKKQYFYETNISISKLFDSKMVMSCPMKGEIDGMIISLEDDIYSIEVIIETKSSLKSTFDDIEKFVQFHQFILKLCETNTFPNKILYRNYTFTVESFNKIIHQSIPEWSIYICINNYSKFIRDNIIEKSHLYFSSVIKIVDDKFIKDFYIDNNDNSIIEKYQIIENNRQLINRRFQRWCDTVDFGKETCNIFYLNDK
jgi:hypothetical protein